MNARAELALAIIRRRAAGVPDREADRGTVNHATRILRGTR